MQNTFCTDRTTVASHTRQSIAAAATRAAQNVHNGFLVGAAASIAREEPAIPDHGIMLPEFFELLLSRVRNFEGYSAFLASFQAAAAQDPDTQLIFHKIIMAQASAIQNANANTTTTTTTTSSSPPATTTTALSPARNVDHGTYMGGAWCATTSGTPLNAVPPTLEEIRAAVPEGGITVHDLIRLFHTCLVGNLDRLKTFISQITTVAHQDPVTNLVFPRK
ncbi:hypothetical protein MBLNU13_g04908t2 [Cladosporium sp. NU13]